MVKHSEFLASLYNGQSVKMCFIVTSEKGHIVITFNFLLSNFRYICGGSPIFIVQIKISDFPSQFVLSKFVDGLK